MPATRARLARTVAGALVLVAALASAPARAEAAPSLELQGRGFGHGRGMSQWGALGAAQKGLTWQQILAFYYPGTVLRSGLSSAPLKVSLSSVPAGSLRVSATAGLMVDTGRCVDTLPVDPQLTDWRVTGRAGTWQLSYYSRSSSTWRTWSSRCAVAAAPSVLVRDTNHVSTSQVVVWNGSRYLGYRGWLRAVPSGSSMSTVNEVTMDQYLWSVVPSEMPASWDLDALAAQSVAARSYAGRRLGTGTWSDICDTISCQVYSGMAGEEATARTAVARTGGVVVRAGSAIAFTEFSAWNGGWTAAGSVPYQVAKADPYDGVNATPAGTWRVTIPLSRLESDHPSIGRLRAVRSARTGGGLWGGRVTSVVLVGTAGTATVSGDSFRSRYGLRSTWFAPASSSPGDDLPLDGFSDLLARDAAGVLWVYSGDGRGAFPSRIRVTGGAGGATAVLSPGDVDGDGRADVWMRLADGRLLLYSGTGAGTLRAGRVVGSGWGTYGLLTAAGDLDRDGRTDLLARDASGTLWRYPGDGRGGWLTRVRMGGGWSGMTTLVAAGDLDRDGRADLLAVDRAGGLWRYPVESDGSLAAGVRVGSGWGAMRWPSGPGDVDGDGLVDLVAVDAAGRLRLYAGTGTGGFRSARVIGSGWSAMRSLTA